MSPKFAIGLTTLALAGCSSGFSYDPNGPWSAGDQGTFWGSCTGNGGSDNFCKCALEYTMSQVPQVSDLPNASPYDSGASAWADRASIGGGCAPG